MAKAGSHPNLPAPYREPDLPVPDAELFTRATLMPINDDAMEPTLWRGCFVLVLPVDAYLSEGVYVVEQPDGSPRIFRVYHAGRKGFLTLKPDNPLYPLQEIAIEDFNAIVLGRVAYLGQMIWTGEAIGLEQIQ